MGRLSGDVTVSALNKVFGIGKIWSMETVKIRYESGAMADYPLKGMSGDKNVLIVEEGPGLTAVIRWNFSGSKPSYQLAGHSIRVFNAEEELIP